jgi:hypothetical protein
MSHHSSLRVVSVPVDVIFEQGLLPQLWDRFRFVIPATHDEP